LTTLFLLNHRCKIRKLEAEEILAATRGGAGTQPPPNLPLGGANTNDTTNNPKVRIDKLVQLTRLNIPIEDTNLAQEAMNNSAVLNSYDILAVQPQSDRAFAFACNSLDIDIISLDLSKRLSYRFRPDLIKTALQRGVYFEILYAPLLREPGSRRQMFANSQSLARETRGRGIILSSGARTAIELRGPYDVVNLATFLGMSEAQAHAAVGQNAAAVVEHAKKRKAFRGTLIIRVSFQEYYTFLQDLEGFRISN
jgi:ribonuclease P/MRP protein subunit RPP1